MSEFVNAILSEIHGLYDRPIMNNSERGVYVEIMVRHLLGNGWTYVGDGWAPYDLRHENGAKLEVKQSAAVQAWPMMKPTTPQFSIKETSWLWEAGANIQLSPPKRLADAYIFALHTALEAPDHRNPAQWSFMIIESYRLPAGQKTIGVNSLRKIGVIECGAGALKERVYDVLGIS